ncbi:acetoacetyl-CoA synthetase, partial [mine drainage metagenome]
MEILWEPGPREHEQSLMARFDQRVRESGERVGAGYEGLWEWSTDHPDRFWPTLADFFEVRFASPWTRVLDGPMPATQWFPGATLNYAAYLLQGSRPGGLAIIFRNEEGLRITLTNEELREAVGALARDLEASGVG